jgi:CBS domain-containing protein
MKIRKPNVDGGAWASEDRRAGVEKPLQIRVKDVMSRNICTVRADTNIQDIARLMTEQHLRSLPVVDEDQRVIGIITESDLFLKEKGMPFSAVKLPALFEKWVDPAHLAEIYEDASHHTAADVMTEDVIFVDPEETIGHAALLLFKHDFKTLPVVEGGRLVGLISRVDFIRFLAGEE